MGCTRASSSPSSAQTLTCGAASLETSCCQVTVAWCDASHVLSSCATSCFEFCSKSMLNNAFPLLLKAGTLCLMACPSGSRQKSKACSQPAQGAAFASPAPLTETSQCGVEEQCWPTCPHSAVRGSVRKNTKSTGHRSSSGSASEVDCCEVCSPDSTVT